LEVEHLQRKFVENRLIWARHVQRMHEDRLVERIWAAEEETKVDMTWELGSVARTTLTGGSLRATERGGDHCSEMLKRLLSYVDPTPQRRKGKVKIIID